MLETGEMTDARKAWDGKTVAMSFDLGDGEFPGGVAIRHLIPVKGEMTERRLIGFIQADRELEFRIRFDELVGQYLMSANAAKVTEDWRPSISVLIQEVKQATA